MSDNKKLVKVQATRKGYFGKQRVRVGDTLLIAEEMFSEAWMKKVDDKKDAAPKKAAPSKAKAKEEDVI